MVKKKKVPAEVKLVRESKKKQSYKNKHISYSQLYSYNTCPRQWYLTYVKKLAPYTPTIYTVFGKAIHKTIQDWLDVVYNETVKKAMEMNLSEYFYKTMVKEYKSDKNRNGFSHFSDIEELNSFYEEGVQILDYIKKKRGAYFTTKKVHLAGIETLLYQELKSGVYFKGYIDLVFYDERVDRWKIVDIKTSTSGWKSNKKRDDRTTAQILLYKEFFSKQFNIDISKIDVEYFIVKRKVPEEVEFASMKKRIQEYTPASGKIKRGKALSFINKFIKETLDEEGNFIDKEYFAHATAENCRFCVFKDNPICPANKSK